MRLRKQADKPHQQQTHSITPAQRWPSNYNNCECGGVKSTQSVICRECRKEREHPVDPRVNGYFTPPLHNRKGTRVQVDRPPLDPSVYKIDGVECRRIPLTNGQYSLVWETDYNRLTEWTWYALYAKSVSGYYACTSVLIGGKRKNVKMHHVIFNSVDLSSWDHKNHDTLDNRRSNLRPCTHSQSGANRRKMKNNTSGYKGVHWNTGHKKWVARIEFKGGKICLGDYSSKIEAAKAYDEAAIRYFGEFANLNFP